nr:flavodoxin [Mammaliicoccus sp. Marseille-Q6498]
MRLVIYFSRTDENLVNGEMVNLEIGNTAVIAKKIAQYLSADLVEIIPVKQYPQAYDLCLSVSKNEKMNLIHPEYTMNPFDLEAYDEMIIGYPNWWGTYPMVVSKFLEDHDLSNKKIYPFCTHEGSGLGTSLFDLKKACPSAQIEQGLAIYGSKVDCADKAIENWLKR